MPIDNLPAALAQLRHIADHPDEHPYTAPAAELVLAAIDRVTDLCQERAGGMIAPGEVMARLNGKNV